MNTQQWLFLAIVFGVVVGLVWLAVMTLLPAPLRRRLLWFMAKEPAEAEAARGGAGGAGAAGAGGWVERVVKVARPFTKLSLPEEGWERSPLRTRFMNAGWRHPSTGALYFAAKSMLALLIPALVALFGGGMLGKSFLLVLFISASIGYYLP